MFGVNCVPQNEGDSIYNFCKGVVIVVHVH